MVFKELEKGVGREKRKDEGCEMSVGLRGKGNQKVRAANLRNQAPRNFWTSWGRIPTLYWWERSQTSF